MYVMQFTCLRCRIYVWAASLLLGLQIPKADAVISTCRGCMPGCAHRSHTQADSAMALQCRWVSRPSDYMLAHFALFAQVSWAVV